MKPQHQLHQRDRTTKMLQEAAERAKREESTVLVFLRQKDLQKAWHSLCFDTTKGNRALVPYYDRYIRVVLYADIKAYFNWEVLTISLVGYADKLVLVDHLVIAAHYYNTNYAEGAARDMLTRYDLQPV